MKLNNRINKLPNSKVNDAQAVRGENKFVLSSYIERRLIAQGILDSRGSAINIVSQRSNYKLDDHVLKKYEFSNSQNVREWCEKLSSVIFNENPEYQVPILKYILSNHLTKDTIDAISNLRTWPLIPTINLIMDPICDRAETSILTINREIFTLLKQEQERVSSLSGTSWSLGAHRFNGVLSVICKLMMNVDNFNRSTQAIHCNILPNELR